MYIRRALAAALVASLLSGLPLLADPSDAEYEGTVHITNAGAATTGVTVLLETNTDAFIDAGILDPSFNNAWFTNAAGNAMAFMNNPTDTDQWYFYYPWSLPASTSVSYLYMGGPDMSPPIRYLPGADGAAVTDAASMELGDTFSVELKGYLNTANDGILIEKPASFSVACAGGDITAALVGDLYRTTNITPATFNAWVDVDVSALVPSTATGVIVEFVAVAPAASGCSLRPNGSADNFSSAKKTAHMAGYVGIDANGIFETYIVDSAGSHGSLYLLGYSTSEWTFLSAAENLSIATTAAWTDVTVAHDGATAAILDVVNTGASSYSVGLRANGVTAAPTYNWQEAGTHSYALVGLDGTEKFEMYISNTAVDCYLVGYITDGYTYLATPVDKSLASTGAYANIDCSANAPGATALVFDLFSNGDYDYDLRADGDTENHVSTGYLTRHFVTLSPCVESICEGYIESTVVDWYLTGYITDGITFLDDGPKATVASVASGAYEVSASADGTNLTLQVGTSSDVDALDGASAFDKNSDWQIGSMSVTPYLESASVSVSGTTVCALDFTALPDATGIYADSSPSNNDATATFPAASSDPDVTAALVAMVPADPADPPGTSSDEGSGMAGGLPDEPDNLFDELDVDHIPGAAVVNALLDAGDIPQALFWFLFVFVAIVVLCLLTYRLSRSLMAVSLVAGAGMLFASKVGIIPYWVTVPLVIIALAVLVKEKMSPL